MYVQNLILKWPSDPQSSLYINPDGENGDICALLFIKLSRTQTDPVPIHLPQDMGLTVDMFQDAWLAQGEEWEHILDFEPLMTVHSFWLPCGALFWFQFTLTEPYGNSCFFVRFTKDTWQRRKDLHSIIHWFDPKKIRAAAEAAA